MPEDRTAPADTDADADATAASAPEVPAKDPPATATPYADDAAFKSAIDAIIERLDARHRLRNALMYTGWLSLLGIALIGPLLKSAFDWDAPDAFGFKLQHLGWISFISATVVWWWWVRRRHGRLIRERWCFGCARSLVDVPTDDDERGCCPDCGRAFHVAQYRLPSAVHGRDFRGYRDRAHFDAVMKAVGERLVKRSSGAETLLLNLFGAAFVGTIILGVFGDTWVFAELGEAIGMHGGWATPVVSVALIAWGWWHYNREQAFSKRVVAEQLCMDCGYALRDLPLDDDGLGRCPECGTAYVPGQYEAPADED